MDADEYTLRIDQRSGSGWVGRPLNYKRVLQQVRSSGRNGHEPVPITSKTVVVDASALAKVLWVRFSPSGNVLAVGFDDSSVRLWQKDNTDRFVQDPVGFWLPNVDFVDNAIFSTDHLILSVAWQSVINVPVASPALEGGSEAPGQTGSQTQSTRASRVLAVPLSRIFSNISTAFNDRADHFIPYQPDPASMVKLADLSPDSKALALLYDNNEIHVLSWTRDPWKPATTTLSFKVTGLPSTDTIRCIRFHPAWGTDNHYLCICGSNRLIALIDRALENPGNGSPANPTTVDLTSTSPSNQSFQYVGDRANPTASKTFNFVNLSFASTNELIVESADGMLRAYPIQKNSSRIQLQGYPNGKELCKNPRYTRAVSSAVV